MPTDGRVAQVATESLLETGAVEANAAQVTVETAHEEPAVIVAGIAQVAIETLYQVNDQAAVAQVAIETLIVSDAFGQQPPRGFIEVIFDGDTEWTDIAADVVHHAGVNIRRGIEGRTPIDLVASSGEATFTLRNDVGNSGATQGWYSPRHAACRTGWMLGIPIRINILHALTLTTVFRGRICQVSPDAGRYRNQRVRVVAYDHMDDMLRTDVRELALAVGETDAALYQAVYDALPSTRRPPATDFDTAFDSIAYAFDDLQSGMKAAGIARNIAISTGSIVFCAADGTLTTRNRQTRATGVSQLTLDDNMHGLTVVTSTDTAFSRVRVTNHPKTVGSAAVVLYQETAVLSVFPGQTLAFWVTYYDENDVRTLIGGGDIIAPLANTDYAADSLADGSGTDMTADLTVTVTPFASAALVQITNNAAQDAYLVNNVGQPLFRIRGTPVYDDGERVFEASSDELWVDHQLDVDMPYQSDGRIGQSFADYWLAATVDPTPIDAVELLAKTDEHIAAVIGLEVGDRITVVETVTGVNNEVVIQNVELTIGPGMILTCRWGVAPAPSVVGLPTAAQDPDDPTATDLIVTYTGPASGTHNLSTDGPLVLSTLSHVAATVYGLSFNRFGASVRIKGVAAGQFGGFADELNQAGGPGGDSGASNVTGVVVPLTALNYEAKVGDTLFDITTSFRLPSSTIFLQLTQTADVGVGGVNGSAGGIGMTLAPGTNGTSGVTGGGGGGGAGGLLPGPSSGGDGGNGTDQTGGAGGVGPNDNGAAPSPDGPGDATPSGGQNDGGGGGSGGGVLLGGIYAGGGGGGAGHAVPYDYGNPAAGGQGVLTIELEP